MSVATKSNMILESTINQFTKYLSEAFLPFIVSLIKLTLLLISSLKLDFLFENKHFDKNYKFWIKFFNVNGLRLFEITNLRIEHCLPFLQLYYLLWKCWYGMLTSPMVQVQIYCSLTNKCYGSPCLRDVVLLLLSRPTAHCGFKTTGHTYKICLWLVGINHKLYLKK